MHNVREGVGVTNPFFIGVRGLRSGVAVRLRERLGSLLRGNEPSPSFGDDRKSYDTAILQRKDCPA